MNIGEPKKVIVVEPLKVPIPERRPASEPKAIPEPQRVRVPA